MLLTQEPGQQFTNEDGSPATWLEVVPTAKRWRGFLLFAIPGALLALALWGLQLRAHILSPSTAWGGGLLLGLGALLGAAAFSKDHSRRFSVTPVRYSPRQRLARAWGWVLAGALLEALFIGSALRVGPTTAGALEFWLLALCALPGLARGLHRLFQRQAYVPTAAAASAKAFLDDRVAQRERARTAAPESPAARRLRHLAALPLGALDVYLWVAQPFGYNHWAAALCGLVALACVGELVGVVLVLALVGALLWALFAGLAAIPTSVAIILGAFVLAGMLRR